MKEGGGSFRLLWVENILLTWILLALISGGNALALDFLDGDLTLHGKIITQVGIHLEDAEIGGPDFESGDLSMAQTIADLEASYALGSRLRFSGIVRGFKEWAYQLSGAYESRFEESGHGFLDPYGAYGESYNRENRYWGEEVELREGFVDVDLSRYGTLRLGKQQITWGESDGIRLADIINPLNIARHFIMESWEDLRIPIWAAYGNFKVPAAEDFTFDVVFTPDYERAVRGEPGSGAIWAFPIPNSARGFNPWGADMMPYFEYNTPCDGIDNSEYGMRIRYKSPIAGAELSAFYFHSNMDTPILRFEGEFWQPPAPVPPIPGPGGTYLPVIHLKYPDYDNIGFTINAFVPAVKAVLRTEFVFIKDIYFNNAVIPDPNDVGTTLGFSDVKTDQYKIMVGFDKNVFIPLLNPLKSFFVSGQYFYMYTKDADDLIDSTYTDQSIPEDTHIITLKVNTAYLYEKLAPDVLFIWSPDEDYWNLQTKLTYTTTDFHWHYTIGANFFDGDSQFMEFGLFRKNDEVYGQISYTF